MDFEQLKIREYDLWDLYLHKQQYPYIGRCYAAAKHRDANLVTDMTPGEYTELFETILPDWHMATVRVFGANRPNLAILGNTWQHLHAHMIPRYKNPVTAYQHTFKDPNPAGNYSPYRKLSLPGSTLESIKERISREL